MNIPTAGENFEGADVQLWPNEWTLFVDPLRPQNAALSKRIENILETSPDDRPIRLHVSRQELDLLRSLPIRAPQIPRRSQAPVRREERPSVTGKPKLPVWNVVRGDPAEILITPPPLPDGLHGLSLSIAFVNGFVGKIEGHRGINGELLWLLSLSAYDTSQLKTTGYRDVTVLGSVVEDNSVWVSPVLCRMNVTDR